MLIHFLNSKYNNDGRVSLLKSYLSVFKVFFLKFSSKIMDFKPSRNSYVLEKYNMMAPKKDNFFKNEVVFRYLKSIWRKKNQVSRI